MASFQTYCNSRSLLPSDLKHESKNSSVTSSRVAGFHFGDWSLSISTNRKEKGIMFSVRSPALIKEADFSDLLLNAYQPWIMTVQQHITCTLCILLKVEQVITSPEWRSKCLILTF